MDIQIRKSTEADLSSIYELVKELAIYEEAEEQVTVTLQEYITDYRAGIYQCHVAEIEGKVVGMALYYMTYSTWKGKMLYLEVGIGLELV